VRLAEGVELLADYQQRLAAQNTFAVLLIIQGIDAAGKDGTIKHVMSGVNPQGVTVHSFKVPSTEGLSHDYLWRYQRQLPARGRIGIFNRSHYEEVAVVRVHPELLANQQLPGARRGNDLWEHRFREINSWERYLADNGIRIAKVFLHISRDEQRTRLLARIDDPARNWKFSPSDLAERQHWGEYQHAYSQMLSNTSTEWAPWHIVPANHKWFARAATAAIPGRCAPRHRPAVPAARRRRARVDGRRTARAGGRRLGCPPAQRSPVTARVPCSQCSRCFPRRGCHRRRSRPCCRTIRRNGGRSPSARTTTAGRRPHPARPTRPRRASDDRRASRWSGDRHARRLNRRPSRPGRRRPREQEPRPCSPAPAVPSPLFPLTLDVGAGYAREGCIGRLARKVNPRPRGDRSHRRQQEIGPASGNPHRDIPVVRPQGAST